MYQDLSERMPDRAKGKRRPSSLAKGPGKGGDEGEGTGFAANLAGLDTQCILQGRVGAIWLVWMAAGLTKAGHGQVGVCWRAGKALGGACQNSLARTLLFAPHMATTSDTTGW